ncbi:la protein homolog [Periplaneta americana]|uniref:la protein homolog n=1 Tax=Periplaneta americana TaxID=6978 RepID=UPI0037E7A0B5
MMAKGDANGFEVEKSPTLNSQIVRQIEYYFGDINLPRDKFLQEQISLDDGWVFLHVILKFQRMSKLTTDCDVIVSALEASELIEVSEDKKKIRRNPCIPLPVFNEERREELNTRSVYCKGFPQETTMDQLLEFFNSFGPTDGVKMIFKDKKENKLNFIGLVFVIFKTKELAAKFLDQDVVKYEDIELLKNWRSAYNEDKRKRHQEEKKAAETVLHLKGTLGEATRKAMRRKLMNKGLNVANVIFNKSKTSAWIKLIGKNSTNEFVEKLVDKKLKLWGSEFQARALEGEEQTKYLKKINKEVEKNRKRNEKRREKTMGTTKNNRGRRGARGDGLGRGMVLKRKGSPVQGGSPAKSQKIIYAF